MTWYRMVTADAARPPTTAVVGDIRTIQEQRFSLSDGEVVSQYSPARLPHGRSLDPVMGCRPSARLFR